MESVKRSSNIELLRIVFMLMIVLHHYCVNSGLTEIMRWDEITPNMILIQFMSIGGKVGVNGFFLISGYFMIHKLASIQKTVKLLFEVLFYNIVVFLFFLAIGVEYTRSEILECFVPILFSIPASFIGNYLLIYILSPIINKGLKALSYKEFNILLIVLVVFYSILQTFFRQNTWQYFGWGFTMYSVGAYIRLYGINLSRKTEALGTFACLLFIWFFELFCDFGTKFVGGGELWHKWMYMFTDANKFPVFAMSVFMFLWFKNMNLEYNKYINKIAASCFGVLMIHANSWPMIRWLWGDTLNNVGFYHSPYLWLHMLLSVIGIYVICTLIDMLRINYIERPLFSWIYRK